MSKILFINKYLNNDIKVGGAEESSRLLLNEISKYNKVYTISFWKKNKIEKKGNVINIYIKNSIGEIRFINHIINQINFKVYIKAKKIIEKISPDIIHFNNIRGFPAYLIYDLNKYNIIHTLRDYNTLCLKNSLYRKGSICKHCVLCSIQSKYKMYLYGKSIDVLISNSQLTLDIHNSYGYKSSKQKVIYAGYGEKNSKSNERIKINNPIIGFIGRINEQKGCLLLNDIAKELFKKTASKLIVAGSGDSKIIANFNHFVDYKGFMKAEDFYKLVDVIIVPSLWNDPLPRIIFETISNNVIPFVSSKTGAKEIIENIDSSLIFDPASQRSIKHMIAKATDSKYLEKILHKITQIEKSKKFSVVKTGLEYNKLYIDLINK